MESWFKKLAAAVLTTASISLFSPLSYAYASETEECSITVKRSDARVATAIREGSITIKKDTGGCIVAYTRTMDRLPQAAIVRLTGDCRSACTLFIGHPGACTVPTARFLFHGPSWNGRAMDRTDFERSSNEMASYYPEPIRSWFLTTVRHQIGLDDYETISGRKLIELGVLPRCSS